MKKRREIYMQRCIISIGVALFRHGFPSSIPFCHSFRPLFLFASFLFLSSSVKKKITIILNPYFLMLAVNRNSLLLV